MYFTIKLIRFCVRLVLWPFRLTLSLLSAVLGSAPGVTGGGGVGDAGGEWSPKRFVWILYGLAAFQLHGAYLAMADETIYGLDRTRSILYASPIVDYGYVLFMFPSDSDGVWLLWVLGFLGYAAAYGYVGRQVSTEGRLSPSLRKKSRAFFAANAVAFVMLPAMYARAVMAEYPGMNFAYGDFYDGTGVSLLGYALLMGGLYVYADRIKAPATLPDRPPSDAPSASTASDGAAEASPASTAADDSSDRSDSGGSSSEADDAGDAADSPTPSSGSSTADSTPSATEASAAGGGDSPPSAADDASTTAGDATATASDASTSTGEVATTADAASTADEDTAATDRDAAAANGDASTTDQATELTYSSATAEVDTERTESTIEPPLDGLVADDAEARESAIDDLRTRASTDPESLAGELESLRTAIEEADDRDVNVAVVEVLAELDDPAATEALERLRLDPDQAVSDAACRVLREE